jgi:anti-anti-sigma regulatory factor
MSNEWHEEQQGRVLTCSGDYGSIECAELHQTLVEAIDSQDNVIVDLAQVTQAGTMMVQVICSVERMAEMNAKGFHIQASSDAWKQACERIGIEIGVKR